MASKLQCPNCGRSLKEQGDEGKMAQGSYLVHERLPDAAGSREARSGVECLECGHMAPACEFDPIMAYASTARNESTKVGGAGDGQEHDA